MSQEDTSIWERIKAGLVFRFLWLISTAICVTVRMKAVGRDKLDDLVQQGQGGIIAIWHGATILPIYYCRNMRFCSMVSTSRDGELQNRLLKSRGFQTIRGSSGRHGIRALLECVRRVKDGAILAVTPDGPKGPPKQVQSGTIHLAQRCGCPILVAGVACKPSKRLKSWDSHMIPLPFARAAIAFEGPLHISEDDDAQEAARKLEAAINCADQTAEAALGMKKRETE